MGGLSRTKSNREGISLFTECESTGCWSTGYNGTGFKSGFNGVSRVGGGAVVWVKAKLGSVVLVVVLSRQLVVTSIESYTGILLQMQLAHV